MAANTWLAALGGGLQAFGQGREQSRLNKVEEDDRQQQLDMRKQAVQRALARDQIEDLRYEQEQRRRKATDLLETAAPGGDLSPEQVGTLQQGGFGHMAGSQVMGNIPSQFTSPDLMPDIGRAVLQPTRRDIQLRDTQMAESQQRTEDMAWRQKQFAEQQRQFGIEQQNALKRIQAQWQQGPKDLSPTALLQLYPSALEATAQVDEDGTKRYDPQKAQALLVELQQKFGGAPTGAPTAPIAPGLPTRGPLGPTSIGPAPQGGSIRRFNPATGRVE